MTRFITLACAIAGLALALYLLIDHDLGDVLSLLAKGGIGLIAAALVHILPMVLNAHGWRILVPGQGRPGLGLMSLIVWARESVNGLLPVARVGGELISIRMMMLFGQSRTMAVSSLVVDLTIGVGAQLILTLLAVGILVLRGMNCELLQQALAGLLIGLPLMMGAYFAQRANGFERMARIIDKAFRGQFSSIIGASARIDRAITTMYRRPRVILASIFYQVLGWLSGGLELWVALYALGQPISLLDAIIIEALIQALSSAAFIVPGALGVQEGGFLVFGGLIGLGPEAALALALARRLRDIVIFGPGLLIMPLVEGRFAFGGAKAAK